DNLLGSIAGELATTLFQGGKLRADIDATKARLQAQAARYAQTVLQALREVEDALARNRQLSQRLEHISVQLQQARLAESLSQSRYGRGITPLLTVLESERRRQEAEDTYLLVQQQLWNARIDLHLALGGDWLGTKPSPLTAQTRL
ncbi:MAG: TolC family protein, partial [Methylococcales bacterium]|nr:TolC family protein [Methylococcales bacterium]